MDLYILRHGQAGQSTDSPEDTLRELTSDGKSDIRKIARWVQSKKLRFDVIATSPLPRASQTAEIVARRLHRESRVVVWDELSPGGDLSSVCSQVGKYGPDTKILIVGHEPALSHLIGKVITGGGTAYVSLAKGGLARIRNCSFEEGRGELHWLLTPKMMIDML